MFQTFIYHPILETLVFIYQNFSAGDLGIAILLLTLLVRIVLFPLFWKSAKDQAAMQKIQPEIERIQKDYKDKPEEQAKQLMAAYKAHHVNPLSSILVMVVQLPIFFALFKIMSAEVLTGTFSSTSLFGLFSLKDPGIDFAIIAAILQYVQFKITVIPTNNKQAGLQRILGFVVPIVTFFVLLKLPRALGLYWIATTIFSIIQQWFVNRKSKSE